METLILNAGSSSVKFRTYRNEDIVLDGTIERIGGETTLSIRGSERRIPAADHREAGLVILALLERQPDMIVHRIVHGGRRKQPVGITQNVLTELDSLANLAPLHMPPALALVRLFTERTNAEQIACFDTMFHRTMPAIARTYAIPKELARKHGIERYGFHGLAHQELAEAAAAALKRPLRSLTLITCQLGNGVSLCAVKGGKSVDTTMGFSPLEGLVMGTRSGSVDPAIVAFLCRNGMSPEEALDVLEKRSGLLGLAGSNDVRDLLRRARSGDSEAAFALDLFAYRARMQIGAYIAVLGSVDAVVLGGGIARAPEMRTRILAGLEHVGIVLDGRKNKGMPASFGKGNVSLLALETDEQELLFRIAKSLSHRLVA